MFRDKLAAPSSRASSPRRIPGTLRHAVSVGYGVGGDWFSENEMPANRANEAQSEARGRNEVKLEVVL